MLGRLEFTPGGRGKGRMADLYGLRVLSVQADPEGCFGTRRVRRAGVALRRGGVVRTLLPREFAQWELLARLGLRPIEPAPFLRAQAPELAVAALEGRDIDPRRATVALSGARADGDMFRSAVELCPRVRRLVIAAPGGGRLACRLREEFGIPVLPADHPAQLDLRFQPGGPGEGTPYLELYGRTPSLDGLRLEAPGLAAGEREALDVLCALWERGMLGGDRIKIHRN